MLNFADQREQAQVHLAVSPAPVRLMQMTGRATMMAWMVPCQPAASILRSNTYKTY